MTPRSHKAPDDERGGELYEREVILRLLLPADEQLAVTVEPRVRAFDDPSAGSLATPTAPALFAATTNVRDEAAPPDRFVDVGVIIALVKAEVLRGEGGRPNDASVEQLSERGLVRRIGRRDDQRDRRAAAVGEDMALRPRLRTVGGVRPRFFPRPAALCARRRRRTARSTPSSRRRHSTGGGAATSPPTRRVRPSAGIADAPSIPNRTLAGRPSTGSPSAARRERHRESAGAESRVAHASAVILARQDVLHDEPQVVRNLPDRRRPSPARSHRHRHPSTPLRRAASAGRVLQIPNRIQRCACCGIGS